MAMEDMEEGLSASEKETSLRESDTPKEVSVKEMHDMFEKLSPQPSSKVMGTPDPELSQENCGNEALPHSPQEITTSTEMDFDFVEHPPQEFFCPVTFELLLTPYLTACCGNHLSERAVNRINQENKPCPICKEPKLNTLLDKFHRRRVCEVRVRCPHTASGCEWVGEVGELSSHTDTCLRCHETNSTSIASSISV